MLNGLHIIQKGLENNVDKEIFYNEISSIMIGLYEDFLRCLKRPDLLQENWNNIRRFYKEGFEQYEKECFSSLQTMMGIRIRGLLRQSLNTKVPLNIRRFLKELKDCENCPSYYLTNS